MPQQARALVMGGAAVAIATAAFSFWPRESAVQAPPAALAPAAATPLQAPPPPAAQAVAAPLPVPAAAAAASVPPGVTPGQWSALQAELAGRPAELARLAAYFTFQDAAARFRDSRSQGATPERVALARTIDAGLDERLAQAELGAGEARLLKMAVLEVLASSDAERQAALERWQQQPRPEPAGQAARLDAEAAFQRRQAEIATAWNAQPAAQRDAQALQRQLDALRRSSFAAATPTHPPEEKTR